jgi:hypothetical protein
MKVLNNIIAPKAMLYRVPKTERKNSQKTSKTGQKSAVIKPIGGFLTHN